MIKNPPTNYAFNQYRCVIYTVNRFVYSDNYQFRIKANLNGNMDTAWNNPANWECSPVPDQYVDVIIPGGKTNYPTVSNPSNVNSLKLENVSTVTVKTGVSIDIKSRQQNKR